MIIKIKKINERSFGMFREKPIFEIELHIARNIDEKLSLIFKNKKKKLTKNIK
tara:strand:+ start:701 stop:859 length:159 start_codon:yes stop_codon:yes gene_type:complete